MRNNRDLGNNTERKIIKLIGESLGLIPFNGKNFDSFQIGSTRLLSRHKDALKIDIGFERTNHVISNKSIQIKHETIQKETSKHKINVSHLDEIKGDNKTLITVVSQKKGDRYYQQGAYVTISLDDYLDIINKLEILRNI